MKVTRQMSNPQLSPAGLIISDVPEGCLSVDILFFGRRIWTVEVPEFDPESDKPIPWPEVLRPHLSGYTVATITDSGTGEPLWHGEVRFSDDAFQTTVQRSDTVGLSVNKWGKLVPDLASMSDEVIASLLKSTQGLIDFLQARGKRPFIVGGTLLGAVRGESLLPHDDDVDIAFLSEHTLPALVGAETLALQRDLQAAGYEVIEHSAAHLQLIFRDELAMPSYHIDVFAAFFSDDGHINQPFHVRGPFRLDQMLPFSEATLHGLKFPAPADTESWLVMNYDENWRTPIPGFKLDTPESTSQRFDNWFGGFNFKRDFWDDWHISVAEGPEFDWGTGRRWIEQQQLDSHLIFDLGCGAGELSESIARRHPRQRVVGADFSEQAIARAVSSGAPNLSFVRINLSRLSTLLLPRQVRHNGAFDVVANHVLEQISHLARENALRLVRQALSSGGRAFATFYGSLESNVSANDPTTWHLEKRAIIQEAAELGLDAAITVLSPAPHETFRAPYGVTFSLSATSHRPTEPPRKVGTTMPWPSRLRALLSDSPTPGELELRRELESLRAEVIELRRDSLRITEILDLLEDRLTPGSPLDSE